MARHSSEQRSTRVLVTRRMLLFLALVCAAFATVDGAQTPPHRVIGIVEVQRLFTLYPPDAGQIPPDRDLRIDLRARPAVDSRVVATITARDQLEAKEYDYEEAGAVVYARNEGWSLVKTIDGVFAWLSPGDAASFHSLESLIAGDLKYLTGDWDGFVSAQPGSASRERVPGDPARTVAGYLVAPVTTASSHPVFERPDGSARVIRRVTTKDPDAALETTHGIPHRVLVLERRPGWFRVAPADQHPTQMQTAWLQESPEWRFVAVADDGERQQLAERAWGPADWRVRTVATRQLGNQLWVEIEVLSHSFCEDAQTPPSVRARGWIPAHAPSGAPNIWFYSRGC